MLSPPVWVNEPVPPLPTYWFNIVSVPPLMPDVASLTVSTPLRPSETLPLPESTKPLRSD